MASADWVQTKGLGLALCSSWLARVAGAAPSAEGGTPFLARRPDDAETGAEALFRMRPALQDQIAKGSGDRPIEAAVRRMRSMVQSA